MEQTTNEFLITSTIYPEGYYIGDPPLYPNGYAQPFYYYTSQGYQDFTCQATVRVKEKNKFSLTGLQCKFKNGHTGDHCQFYDRYVGDVFWNNGQGESPLEV